MNLMKYRENVQLSKSERLDAFQNSGWLAGVSSRSKIAEHALFTNPAYRRRCAIHEAGHAVAAIAMGGSVVRLQLAGPMKPVFRRDGSECANNVAAMADTLPLACSNERVQERLGVADEAEREAIAKVAMGHAFVSLAGPAAEARGQGLELRRLDRQGRLGAASDMHVAKYHLGPFAGGDANLANLIATIAISADEMFGEPSVWAAVEAVAELALQGVEEGDELMKVAKVYLPSQLSIAPLLTNSDGIGSLAL